MGTYIALAVSFTIIGGFAYLGMKATDEVITYFNQDVPDKKGFVARKMTPRKPKTEVYIPNKPTISESIDLTVDEYVAPNDLLL